MQVIVFSLKYFMFLYMDNDIQISRRPVIFPDLSFSLQAQPHPFFHACRYGNFKIFLFSYQPFSGTVVAGILRQFSLAMTIRAGPGLLEQAKRRTLGALHISRTMAVMALFKLQRSFAFALRAIF